MKKFLIVLLALIGCLPLMGATWLPFSRGWINTGTGLINVTPYPTGVNTWTPTATYTAIPGSFSGATTFNTILGVGAAAQLTPDGINSVNETFIGANAGSKATTGVGDTYIGANIGYINNNIGIESVIVGDSSGQSITNPMYITYLGAHVGLYATSPSHETAAGEGAEARCTTCSDDVFIGNLAGENVSSGDHNVGIGENSLVSVGTGERNTALGYGTDQLTSNYSDCVFLGYLAGSGDSNAADYLEISNRFGPLITGSFHQGVNPGVTIIGILSANGYQVGSTPTPGYELTPSAIPYGAPMTFNNGILTGVAATPTPSIKAFAAAITNPMTPTYFACTPCVTTSIWNGNAVGVVATATPPTVSFIPVAGGVSITLGGAAPLTVDVIEAP